MLAKSSSIKRILSPDVLCYNTDLPAATISTESEEQTTFISGSEKDLPISGNGRESYL